MSSLRRCPEMSKLAVDVNLAGVVLDDSRYACRGRPSRCGSRASSFRNGNNRFERRRVSMISSDRCDGSKALEAEWIFPRA